jgi:hypothetical protein
VRRRRSSRRPIRARAGAAAVAAAVVAAGLAGLHARELLAQRRERLGVAVLPVVAEPALMVRDALEEGACGRWGRSPPTSSCRPCRRQPTLSERTALRTMTRLTRDGRFMGYALTGAFVYMAFFAYLGGSSFVLQHLYGVSPTTYSALFAVNALGMLAAGQANHRLLARFSPRDLLAAALVAFAVAGMGVLFSAITSAGGLWGLAVPFFVIVAGMGVVLPDLTALALSLHPDVAGTASACFGGLRLGLGALAMPLIAIGGTVGATSMGVMIAVTALAALALFAVTARRSRDQQVLLGLPEEAASDVPGGLRSGRRPSERPGVRRRDTLQASADVPRSAPCSAR